MELKAHIKGIVIAAVVAVTGMFVLSFFISSQLTIQESTVVNKSIEEVYSFTANPENFQKWMGNINNVEVSNNIGANKKGIEYIGHDENLHRFEFIEMNKKMFALQVKYLRNEEEAGVFYIKCNEVEDQTVVNIAQLWNLGINPMKKLTAQLTSSAVEDQLKSDLNKLKSLLEK